MWLQIEFPTTGGVGPPVHAVCLPTLAKNARMGHPGFVRAKGTPRHCEAVRFGVRKPVVRIRMEVCRNPEPGTAAARRCEFLV